MENKINMTGLLCLTEGRPDTTAEPQFEFFGRNSDGIKDIVIDMSITQYSLNRKEKGTFVVLQKI